MRNVLCWLLVSMACVAAASTPARAGERVVALGGDITATVYALGAGDMLVGVDSTSEWPVAARQLPDVGYVRQLGSEGVLSLRPTLVIATHDAGPPHTIAQLRATGVDVQVMPAVDSPQDMVARIRTMVICCSERKRPTRWRRASKARWRSWPRRWRRCRSIRAWRS